MRLPARLDVLRLRNFRNLFIGEAVSLLGDGLFPVALTFGVLDLHHSGTDVGIVLAAFSLPMVLFTLIGGVWSDRLRREWVMIASDLVRFVTWPLIAALLLSGHAEVWSLAVLGFVYGCGDAFFFPAYSGARSSRSCRPTVCRRPTPCVAWPTASAGSSDHRYRAFSSPSSAPAGPSVSTPSPSS